MSKKYDTVGQKILERARHQLGLTRQELADKLGTAYSSIFRWEKGQRSIPGPMITAVIQMLEKKKEGTQIHLEVDEHEKQIILTPITREFIQSLCGKYKGRGLLRALMAEKERERGL